MNFCFKQTHKENINSYNLLVIRTSYSTHILQFPFSFTSRSMETFLTTQENYYMHNMLSKTFLTIQKNYYMHIC